MSSIERIVETATALVRQLSEEAQQRSRRRQKRARRLLKRFVTLLGLIALSTFVIVVGMISTHMLFGPRGVEGLIALPLILLATWTTILYFGLRSKPAPRVLPSGDMKELPARTEAWLEEQRWALPAPAQNSLSNILARLETLQPQVEKLDPQSPKAFELRRLIAEELPELVEGYQKVPRALRARPSHGGQSPDRHVIDGLATIDEQMAQLEAQLSEQDLRALATQQRYLELKYKRES
ncbi:MAG: hypothetical protein QM778_29495 [Myxococcales bacterium]